MTVFTSQKLNKMKKRFIILIDFSEYSRNLIKYACDWSKCCKLPQKEYVLKMEKIVTLKRIKHEEITIQPSSDSWDFKVL